MPLTITDQVAQLLPQKTRFSLFSKSGGWLRGCADGINLYFTLDGWRLMLKIKAKCELHLWTQEPRMRLFLVLLPAEFWSYGFLQGCSLFKIRILLDLDEGSMRKCAWNIVMLRSLRLGAFWSAKVHSEHSQVHMVGLLEALLIAKVFRSISVHRVVETFFVESAHNSEWRIVVEWWGQPLGSFHVDHGGICLATPA